MQHRILAIGDVHGCSRALDALLAAVAPTSRDFVITLGDYVDRGPDSAGVLNRLIRLSETHALVALRGNHEEMMLLARDDDAHLKMWRDCGGDAALLSYSPVNDDGRLADVPDEHWEFIERSCIDWYETERHFFVHAGVRPNLALADQTPLVLHWETFDDPPPHVSGKIMICGHTPQADHLPRNIGHAICIDTDVVDDDGWLTCLDVVTGDIVQANERGQVRRSKLEASRGTRER